MLGSTFPRMLKTTLISPQIEWRDTAFEGFKSNQEVDWKLESDSSECNSLLPVKCATLQAGEEAEPLQQGESIDRFCKLIESVE